MKKSKVLLVIFLLLALIICYIWYSSPKEISKILNGVEFHLDDNRQTEKVSILIDGKIKKGLFGKASFEGILDILGEDIPIPNGERDVVISFQSDGMGEIIYTGYFEGKPFTFGYGSIFVNSDFSEIVILKGEEDLEGVLISAPASDRKKAVNIANSLMSDFLNGNYLK